jgi:hypothetical protein
MSALGVFTLYQNTYSEKVALAVLTPSVFMFAGRLNAVRADKK